MKKIFISIITIVAATLSIFFVGCTTNNEQSLANEIDLSVKNFVKTISHLDWPSSEDIEKFDQLNNEYHSDSGYEISEIDTEEIDENISILKSKINLLMSKRADLSSASNELVTGNVNLTEDNYLSIKVYLDIIKDNSNYLTNYVGIIKNQVAEASELIDAKRNLNIVNAYAIKIVETLSIRSSKVDTTILAMNSIIEILNNNLINNYNPNNKYSIEDNPSPNNNSNNNDPIPQENETTPEQNENTEQDNTLLENQAIRIEPDNVRETISEESNELEVDNNLVESDNFDSINNETLAGKEQMVERETIVEKMQN